VTLPTRHGPPRGRRVGAAGTRLVLLLAAVLALVLGLFTAGIASASALPAAGTRVGVLTPTVTTVVGGHECISAGQRWVRGPSQSQIVSGHCVAVEAGGSLADLYAGGRVAPEAELRGYAEREGWTLEQSATGPAKYVDENGVPRLTIKSGSSRTPGSEDPHIEVRDETGQRTDPYGNPVNRRSPDNHYPYEP